MISIKTMRAYYSESIQSFLNSSPESVLGILSRQHSISDLDILQRNAWHEQICILQDQLKPLGEGWIAFEFSIPRMGKRVDNIIVYKGIIFVIEFKVGTPKYEAHSQDQVIDYALDLKNFHEGSHSAKIIPILLATEASSSPTQLSWDSDGIAEVVRCNKHNLATVIANITKQTPPQRELNGTHWASTSYKPTPTIIEAAQALYQDHNVQEISRSEGGAQNLSITGEYLSRVIEKAKIENHKAICFVTGVPGAGKTLAGLNLATLRARSHEEEHAVFLSGNGPLVEVLREALARDSKDQGRAKSKCEALREVKSFVQNIHHFRDEYVDERLVPIEKVVVFDEAQRAWDEPHVSKFMKERKGIANFGKSEPEFLVSVMDRHDDWCVIVCLVGGGQEINSGEAGLSEWFKALGKSFPDWKVYTSPILENGDYQWDGNLGDYLKGMDVTQAEELHLAVSVRSYRAERVSEFVGAIIDGDIERARTLYETFKDQYPIHITRDINEAREWLRSKARGTERYGLVASSGAYRLKPDGLNVKEKLQAPIWFLNGKDDVRSSYYLEDVATEFDVQGLELDWVGVCWDADFRFGENDWSFHQFRGTHWQNVKSLTDRRYIANAYRVLLTRARQGMVIYIPLGSSLDTTRESSQYNPLAIMLKVILNQVKG